MNDRRQHSTRRPGRKVRSWSALLVLLAVSQAAAGEPGYPALGRPHLRHRFGPAGGWNPDGGGLLHWWDPHCFPRCAGPDDYCRKPMPRICWPPYTLDYRWTPPAPGPLPGRP
jgi:hypothetical protein